ncbi:MAG: glutamate racemase, partial [Elusimicrobiota bacterium]
VEEGWLDNEITRQVAEIYLKDFACDVDSLILGCTHYPLLKKVVKEVVGPEVNIIDSAREVSKETDRILSDLDIKSCEERGNLEFYVSDAPELFKKGAEIFLDSEIKTERVLLKEML